ncbi:hypothetical protein TNCV_3779061 [Trichonephila clavipes]|nr:hypothetical protein TNCV_3779061 [Trichonephila clavipes]
MTLFYSTRKTVFKGRNKEAEKILRFRFKSLTLTFGKLTERSSNTKKEFCLDKRNLRILFSDEAHFWLNGYVNKQNGRIWSEANPQVYVETPLHPEKLTVWCALWAGGILLQKR